MAGDKPHVLFDPSIDRWGAMRENVYQYFRMTRFATRKVVMWGFIFPATVATLAVVYDNKFDWAGKRRDQSLLTNPPKQEEEAQQ